MKKQRELDVYLANLMGPLAVIGYHAQGGSVTRKSTLAPTSTVKIPDSSRKAGLGDGR